MPKLRFSDMDWGNWLYGLFAGAIGGGASAVTSAIAVAMVDGKDFAIGSAMSVKVMAMMFAFTVVKDTLLYLKQNPLPKIITETTTESVTVLRAKTVQTEVAPAASGTAETSIQGTGTTPPSAQSPAPKEKA